MIIYKDYLVKRGNTVAMNSKRNFSKKFFSNTFRVDRSIVLTGFSFFPPAENLNDTTYTVVVEQIPDDMTDFCGLKLSATSKYNTVLDSFVVKKLKCDLFGRERIRVNPPRLLLIRPYTWYNIRCKIDGPATSYLNKNRNSCAVVHSSAKGEEHRMALARFDFGKGSSQLPDLHFILS